AGLISVGLMFGFVIDYVAGTIQALADFAAVLRGDMSISDFVKRGIDRVGEMAANFDRRMNEAKDSLKEINEIANSLGNEAVGAGYRVGEQFALGLKNSTPTMEEAMRSS